MLDLHPPAPLPPTNDWKVEQLCLWVSIFQHKTVHQHHRGSFNLIEHKKIEFFVQYQSKKVNFIKTNKKKKIEYFPILMRKFQIFLVKKTRLKIKNLFLNIIIEI